MLAYLFACDAAVDSGAGSPGLGGSKRVVVFVIDGVRMEESFGEGNASVDGSASSSFLPRIRRELLPQGTLVLPAYNLGITITAPGHAQFLTGDTAPFGNFPPYDDMGAYYPDLPTLFELVRAQHGLGEEALGLVGNTDLLDAVGRSNYPGLGAEFGTTYVHVDTDGDGSAGDAAGVEEAWRRITEDRARFVLANLHRPDQMGHYGDEIADYADAVRNLDAPIADFWAKVQADDDLRDSTTLVIVADHGRHRTGEADAYKQHGDSCAGCREIPMFLIGAGVAEGVTISDGVALDDLHATLARLLEVESPYALGRDFLGGELAATGDLSPVSAGGLVLSERRDDEWPRGAVFLGDVPVSAPTAQAAGGAAVAAGSEAAFACWRELGALGTSDIPWNPACAWIDESGPVSLMPMPLPEVNVGWRPALALSPGGVPWMAVADNLNGAVDGSAVDRAVRLLSLGEGWHGGVGLEGVYYPTAPALAVSGDAALVAFAASLDASAGRSNRHGELHEVTDPEGEQAWSLLFTSTGASGAERAERPAIWAHDGRLRLAYTTADDAANNVEVVSSADGGESWSAAEVLDDTGRVFAHLDAQFWDGAVVYARLGDDEAELCVEGTSPRCVGLGATELSGFARVNGGARVSVRVEGEWVLRNVAL
ncbi:MAG: alkaline phosphatase family protein [Deltaproteobacteria bacterium]|nr:alkaline phosphatase family protein [Deltaproteobacteria bacterium]